MNKILVLCAIGLWSLTAAAQSYDYLWVNKTDGTAASFALDNLQKITFTDNDILVVPTAATTQSFAFDAVQKLTFEYSPVVITDIASADSQTTLIYFNREAKEVVIESSKAIGNIAILDLTGRNVAAQNSAYLRATISVSKLPAGVYIVRTAEKVQKLTIYK
jgi:hypothetical protein